MELEPSKPQPETLQSQTTDPPSEPEKDKSIPVEKPSVLYRIAEFAPLSKQAVLVSHEALYKQVQVQQQASQQGERFGSDQMPTQTPLQPGHVSEVTPQQGRSQQQQQQQQ